jgi:hypothetical protein
VVTRVSSGYPQPGRDAEHRRDRTRDGCTAGKDRAIDPLITQRIASDVFLLNRVVTWAADGPYERQKRKRQSGWIAPLIVITAVHVEQETFDGPALPYEFDAMLGRNWAAALANTDILQVAAGFIELDQESAIRLALPDRVPLPHGAARTRADTQYRRSLRCGPYRPRPGQNQARFLERWHAPVAAGGRGGKRRMRCAPKTPPPRAIWRGGPGSHTRRSMPS